MKIIEGFEPLKSILSRQGPSGRSFETDEWEGSVREIINEVSRRGDAALFDFTEKFDGIKLESLKVPEKQIKAAYEAVSPELVSSIRLAAERISAYHTMQRDSLLNEKQKDGTGWLIRPLSRVGVIVPGQAAPLPSSLLMAVLPVAPSLKAI